MNDESIHGRYGDSNRHYPESRDDSDIDQFFRASFGGKDSKSSEFTVNVWDVIDSAGNLLLRKFKDYGEKNVSQSPGGPLNGLRVRMWDKIARINHLIDTGATPQNESLRDSFIDLLNYSAIAIMVLDKTWPGISDE